MRFKKGLQNKKEENVVTHDDGGGFDHITMVCMADPTSNPPSGRRVYRDGRAEEQ